MATGIRLNGDRISISRTSQKLLGIISDLRVPNKRRNEAALEKILGFKLGEKLIKTPARAKQLIQIKYLYKGGKKVYKTVSKFYKNFTEGNYNPFQRPQSQ